MDFEPSYKQFASIFKALSDETRLRVVDMLSCREMSFQLHAFPVHLELSHENFN